MAAQPSSVPAPPRPPVGIHHYRLLLTKSTSFLPSRSHHPPWPPQPSSVPAPPRPPAGIHHHRLLPTKSISKNSTTHLLHTSAPGLFNLCVIEAGNRIGGRIFTSKFADRRVKVGTTWIHDIEGSPVFNITQKIHTLCAEVCRWERMDDSPVDPIIVAKDGFIIKSLVGLVEEITRTPNERRRGRRKKGEGDGRSWGGFVFVRRERGVRREREEGERGL